MTSNIPTSSRAKGSPRDHKLARWITVRLIWALACISLAAGGCSFFEPHKVSIQQGSLVTPKALGQVEPGMSQEQVRYLLGTPLSVDTFDPDLWIYGSSIRRDTKLLTRQLVKLRFLEDKLVSIESEGIARVDEASEPATGESEGIESAER